MNKKYLGLIIVGISLVICYFIFNKNEVKKKDFIKSEVKEKLAIPEKPNNDGYSSEGQPLDIKIISHEVISKGTKAHNPYEKYIDGVKYELYRGYWLPPIPDEKENNKTLGGIDVNKNWVRDDIENEIIRSEERSFWKGGMLQSARTYQMLMLEPEKHPNGIDLLMIIYNTDIPTMESSVFNTPERKKVLKRINARYSGGIYDSFNVEWDNFYFKEKLRDFTTTTENIRESSNLDNYQWDPSFYEDKPIIYYDNYGIAGGTYYKGKFIVSRGIDTCHLNKSKIESKEECYSMIKKIRKAVKENSPKEFIEKGLKNEIFNIH